MLQLELLYENGELVPNQADNLEVYGHSATSSANPMLLNPTSGSLDLKVRILQTSMLHGNKPFFIRVSGIPADKSIPSHVTIMPVATTIMTVIRHRLRITEQPPSIWYKDEGGRDKCININGLLVDEHEQPVQGREVPLRVLLCYEGEDCMEVKNQAILKMPPDSVPRVDKFGRVALKVRIEEVCVRRDTRLLLANGETITADECQVGMMLLDEFGKPTPITAIDRGYKRVDSSHPSSSPSESLSSSASPHFLPRRDRPARDMYEFILDDSDRSSTTKSRTTHPPLVVTSGHRVVLMTKPKDDTKEIETNQRLLDFRSESTIDGVRRHPAGAYLRRVKNDADLTAYRQQQARGPILWEPTAEEFATWLHHARDPSTDEDVRPTFGMYQPSARSWHKSTGASPVLGNWSTAQGPIPAQQPHPVSQTNSNGADETVPVWQTVLGPTPIQFQMRGPNGRPFLADRVRRLFARRENSTMPSDLTRRVAYTVGAWMADPRQDRLASSPLSDMIRSVAGSMADQEDPTLEIGEQWFERLLESLDMSPSSSPCTPRIPIELLTDEVDVRRFLLAGYIDASEAASLNAIKGEPTYEVTLPNSQSDFGTDVMHLVRGLGYGIASHTVLDDETSKFEVVGVPDHRHPLGVPSLSSSKQVSRVTDVSVPSAIGASTFFECDLSRVRQLPPSHEWVAITVPGGRMLNAETVVLHNSKNHQKQAFVIKIAPDTTYLADVADISPDVSNPVTVLSKRNKRRPRRGDGGDEPDSPDGPSAVHMPYAGGMFTLPAVAAAAQAATTSASATHPVYTNILRPSTTASSSTVSTTANTSILPSITPSGTPAKPPSTLAATSLTGNNMTKLASADGTGIGLLPSDNSEYKHAPLPIFSDTISHLVNWSQHVHDLLNRIEWQHVGFEVQEDGQMNLHRPLYRCPGCWSYQDTIRQTGHRDSCKLSKLSSAYRSHVHVYLSDLLSMATSGSVGLPPPQPTLANNPSQLASQNSLMAAYSKNNSGNIFLTHSNSIPTSTMPSRVNSKQPSQLNGAASSGATSVPVSTSAPLASSQPATSPPRTNLVTQGGAGAAKSDEDEPQSKKSKLSHPSADSSPVPPVPSFLDNASLFPADWGTTSTGGNLPLSSPNPAGVAASAPAVLGDRIFSLDALQMGSPFIRLQSYQDPAQSDYLPDDSMNLMRAGSSLNLNALMSASSASDRDESLVDAIHVTATPYGFPAFSATTATPPSALVGFYQYDESTTFLAFVPIAMFPAITPTQIQAMEKIFRKLRSPEGGDNVNAAAQSKILTRQQCITLEKLKEEALLLHYASQASGFLSTE